MTPEACTCGGDLGQPADHHDISCPLTLPDEGFSSAGDIERAAIVAWLNAQADKGFALSLAAPARSQRERDHAAGAIAIQKAANLIATGGHLKETSHDAG